MRVSITANVSFFIKVFEILPTSNILKNDKLKQYFFILYLLYYIKSRTVHNMTFSLISAKGHLYSANACGGGSMRQRHKEENAR